MKILIINGPNLNLLKSRIKKHYGSYTLDEIFSMLQKRFKSVEFKMVQSNSENEFINYIHGAEHNGFLGILINPGAFSHTSVAIRDALEICALPKIEVHLSNIQSRDNFRKVSLTASICDGYISGFKSLSYIAGAFTLINLIEEKESHK